MCVVSWCVIQVCPSLILLGVPWAYHINSNQTANIRLEWKWLIVANALAYCMITLRPAVKGFSALGLYLQNFIFLVIYKWAQQARV